MFNWERNFLTFLTSLRFLLGNLESEASHDSARAKEGQTKSAESDADMTEPHDGTKRSAESGVSPEKKKKWSLAHPLLATVKRLSNDGQGNCLFERVGGPSPQICFVRRRPRILSDIGTSIFFFGIIKTPWTKPCRTRLTFDRPIHCIHETGQRYTFNSEGA